MTLVAIDTAVRSAPYDGRHLNSSMQCSRRQCCFAVCGFVRWRARGRRACVCTLMPPKRPWASAAPCHASGHRRQQQQQRGAQHGPPAQHGSGRLWGFLLMRWGWARLWRSRRSCWRGRRPLVGAPGQRPRCDSGQRAKGWTQHCSSWPVYFSACKQDSGNVNKQC